jgi:hypothetical protein
MGVDLMLIAEIDRLTEEVKLLRARAVAAMLALQHAETDSSPSASPDPTPPPTIADVPDP